MFSSSSGSGVNWTRCNAMGIHAWHTRTSATPANIETRDLATLLIVDLPCSSYIQFTVTWTCTCTCTLLGVHRFTSLCLPLPYNWGPVLFTVLHILQTWSKLAHLKNNWFTGNQIQLIWRILLVRELLLVRGLLLVRSSLEFRLLGSS